MNKAYLLAYSDSLGDRESVKACLNSLPSVLKWRYDMEHAFYIISNESADFLCGEIKNYFKNDGRYIVTELSSNKQGWLTESSWYLINNKQYKPE